MIRRDLLFVVEKFLEVGLDPRLLNSGFNHWHRVTLLEHAVRRASYETAFLLIDHLEKRSKEKPFPSHAYYPILCIVSRYGDLKSTEIIHRLLQMGVDPNGFRNWLDNWNHQSARSLYRTPPLFIAIANWDLPKVKLLLEYGADPNVYLQEVNPSKKLPIKTPLTIAPNVEIAQELFKHGASTDPDYLDYALIRPLRKGDTALVKELLNRGAAFKNEKLREIFFYQSFNNKYSINKYVTEKIGPLPIKISTRYEKLCLDQIEKWLNEDLASLFSAEKEKLRCLTLEQRTKLLAKLLMTSNEIEMIRYLLELGVDLEYYHQDVWPLLFCAIERECLEIVELLLQAGADIHATDSSGDTPLHHAVLRGSRTSIVNLLLKYGSDPNRKNNRGQTPLHLNARYNLRSQSVPILLSHGADPDLLDSNGYSPYHLVLSSDFKRDEGILELILREYHKRNKKTPIVPFPSEKTSVESLQMDLDQMVYIIIPSGRFESLHQRFYRLRKELGYSPHFEKWSYRPDFHIWISYHPHDPRAFLMSHLGNYILRINKQRLEQVNGLTDQWNEVPKILPATQKDEPLIQEIENIYLIATQRLREELDKLKIPYTDTKYFSSQTRKGRTNRKGR